MAGRPLSSVHPHFPALLTAEFVVRPFVLLPLMRVIPRPTFDVFHAPAAGTSCLELPVAHLLRAFRPAVIATESEEPVFTLLAGHFQSAFLALGLGNRDKRFPVIALLWLVVHALFATCHMR